MAIEPRDSGRAISIHALREEGDHTAAGTASHRRNFYPRPPRGGRPVLSRELAHERAISIHPLREEGDQVSAYVTDASTVISIHALREEGDKQRVNFLESQSNFYPRPPRGGRRVRSSRPAAQQLFLSTPSARRATQQQTAMSYNSAISIHALREEGDI